MSSKEQEYDDGVYSKTVNLPMACLPEFSKQVKNLVQEYYNGECKLEARVIFKGAGTVSKGNPSIGCLSSSLTSTNTSDSCLTSNTSKIRDPYANSQNDRMIKKVKDCISTASDGTFFNNQSEDIKATSRKKYHSTVEKNKSLISAGRSTSDVSCSTTTKPRKTFDKLRVYAHPDFMNSSTSETSLKSSSITSMKSKESFTNYDSSRSKTSNPVFDDVKLVFCPKADFNMFTDPKSLSSISFDSNGSPRRSSKGGRSRYRY
uniref:Dentin sialophosphoprotein-like n=1 Tax=Parastrongyloides trichosuri TaxID=131310 RepID=A0A0N4ZIB8_PARTI